MNTETDYFLSEDSPGCFQLTEKTRGLISLALREKAEADEKRAEADGFGAGIFREQARAARMIAKVFDDAIAHVQVMP